MGEAVARFPPELDSLLAVAAAAIDESGALIEANAGFLRLLGPSGTASVGSSTAGFFIQPDFATLARMNGGADGEIHHGLLTVGDPTGRTQSLRGRVWRARGELRVLAEYDVEELGRLYDAVLSLNSEYADAQSQLARANVALRQRETEILALSLTDPLTGLGNRRGFEQALAAEVSRARRANSKLSVCIADLDHFKYVNDIYGHAVGDAALIAFAELLRRHTRAFDIVARLGGEEFVVLMPHTERGPAAMVAGRLREALANARIEPLRDPVTMSIGVAELVAGETGEALLRRADKALYEAKALGRNLVVTG
jgi:diguanylate cyclase (GGDEF)-like protein